MLNYDKIHSAINFQRTAKTKLSRFMGIANSTFIDRLEKKNLTPDDIEKLSDFFNKPIAYFFDRESDQLNDPQGEYVRECKSCKEKDAQIGELKEKLGVVNGELMEMLRKYNSALEELHNKKDQGKCG